MPQEYIEDGERVDVIHEQIGGTTEVEMAQAEQLLSTLQL